jgi:peptidoglycan/LPS O-acetylase OafA/YrhL
VITIGTTAALICGIAASGDPKYLPAAALFLLVIAARNPATAYGHIARNPLLILYGRYCYSIYLFHFVILWALQAPITDALHRLGLDGAHRELRTLVILGPILAACFLVGITSYNLIELNCVRLGRRVITRITQRTAKVPMTQGVPSDG